MYILHTVVRGGYKDLNRLGGHKIRFNLEPDFDEGSYIITVEQCGI